MDKITIIVPRKINIASGRDFLIPQIEDFFKNLGYKCVTFHEDTLTEAGKQEIFRRENVLIMES